MQRSGLEDAAESGHVSITIFVVRVIAKPFGPIYLRQHVAKSFLDSITPFFLPRFDHEKALRFDCGSKESGMKLQVSFSAFAKV